jgi:hypothetical protein
MTTNSKFRISESIKKATLRRWVWEWTNSPGQLAEIHRSDQSIVHDRYTLVFTDYYTSDPPRPRLTAGGSVDQEGPDLSALVLVLSSARWRSARVQNASVTRRAPISKGYNVADGWALGGP